MLGLTLRETGSVTPLFLALVCSAFHLRGLFLVLALTEMPSIFLTALSTYLLVLAWKHQIERRSLAYTGAFVGGALLGLAFLNRAMVLVILAALPCLMITDWRRSAWTVAAFATGTLAVVGPVVVYWRGIVPPHSVVPMSAIAFSVHNLTLSISYAATVSLILAPSWFAVSARQGMIVFGTIFAVNAFFGFFEVSVMHEVVARLPFGLSSIIPRLAGSAMIALAVLFVIGIAKNIEDRLSEPMWLFFCLSMLLLVAAPGKIVHQYSSRYTAMASAMIILASDPFTTVSKWRVVRISLGMSLGLASLLSYYYPR